MRVVRVRTLDRPVDAVVEVPGSKSIANRALVCAALASGTSTLRGVPDGDDVAAMLECLEVLGVGVGRIDGGIVIAGDGPAGLAGGPAVLPARLAGTTSRFITALAALAPGEHVVDGLAPLRARPMAPLHDALTALGVGVVPGETWGHLPVTITGPLRTGGTIELRGDVSSQYLTALMLIGPYLAGGLTLRLTTPLVSRPYIVLTAAVMASFGVAGVEIAVDAIHIPIGQYVAGEHAVEPDASSASYPMAVAALRGGRVTVPGLTRASVQGDGVFADLLAQMGCAVERDDNGTTVSRHGDLIGIDVDMADCSDLVPTLAVVATAATTHTTIRGVGFIRGKESDRIGDLCAELRQAGVHATELADGLRIEPSTVHPARLGTHHDHRLAMAFAVLGTGARGDRGRRRRRGRQELAGLLVDAGRVDVVNNAATVAAFDVDHTITRHDCVSRFLVRLGGRRGIAGALARQPVRSITAAIRRDRDELKEIVVGGILTGRYVDDVDREGRSFAAEMLAGDLRADVVARLRWHLRAGHRVVLVSASLGPYLRPFAELLGVDDVLCTDVAVDAGRYLDRLDGPNCRGAEKVVRLSAWLAERGPGDRRSVGLRRQRRGCADAGHVAPHPCG